jgi:hypothetical protein
MAASQLEVASRFMQNYRYAVPFVNDAQIAAAGGAGDALTVFSVGSDQNVSMVSPSSGTDTGWSMVNLGTPPGTTRVTRIRRHLLRRPDTRPGRRRDRRVERLDRCGGGAHSVILNTRGGILSCSSVRARRVPLAVT